MFDGAEALPQEPGVDQAPSHQLRGTTMPPSGLPANQPTGHDGGGDGGAVDRAVGMVDGQPGSVAVSSSPRLALRPVPHPDAIPTKHCPDGHPNDPEATNCRLCHHHLDAATSIVEVVPTALARLLLEDGTAVDLVDDLIIGRSPGDGDAPDRLVVTGRQVSRVHLVIEVRGWRLMIRDCGSTNGTFTTRRGERGRRRVPEDRSILLRMGETVHFGDRQALVVRPT